MRHVSQYRKRMTKPLTTCSCSFEMEAFAASTSAGQRGMTPGSLHAAVQNAMMETRNMKKPMTAIAGERGYSVWAVEQKKRIEGTQTTAKVPRQLLTSGPIMRRPLQKNLLEPAHVLNVTFCATPPRCLENMRCLGTRQRNSALQMQRRSFYPTILTY
jgi:hypothetical protein